MTSAAVLGVGRIGSALVERLHARGHLVTAFDVREERRPVVERLGARWASTPTEALAGAEVAVTALPGSPELDALVQGDVGPPGDLVPGSIWVDLTSASPELGATCADLAREARVGHLDAPLGGGADAVRSGRATLYVGGEAATLERALPVLDAFAAQVHHVGASGTGHLVKLLVNLIWFGQVGLVTESLLLARRHGLAPDHVAGLLRGSAADSAFVRQHLPALLRGDHLPDFGLDRCVEELAAVEQAAADAELPHPLTSAVADLHRAALRHFGPVDGELLAAAWLEDRAGSRFA